MIVVHFSGRLIVLMNSKTACTHTHIHIHSRRKPLFHPLSLHIKKVLLTQTYLQKQHYKSPCLFLPVDYCQRQGTTNLHEKSKCHLLSEDEQTWVDSISVSHRPTSEPEDHSYLQWFYLINKFEVYHLCLSKHNFY